MAHCNTVFSQLLKLVDRHEFESLANRHHSGRSFRTASRWSQFVAMSLAQLSGRNSLRDIVDSMSAQVHRLYHLGSTRLARNTLSRINRDKPYELYQALFGQLLVRCQSRSMNHGFRFKNPLYTLDSSTIDLCLSLFPWAKFRTTKGAVKLHVGLNHQGLLPEFVHITDGKTTDIEVAHRQSFPNGSIVVIDRGYTDYSWFNALNKQGIFFVTRLKSNAKYKVMQRHKINKSTGLTSDQRILFTNYYAKRDCPIKLRRVGYRDPETGKHYVFLTNHFKLAATTIARLYKARWQIELFFKWIKQNLKIKSFLGTSKNAVLTQIWIALCMYLLLAYLKYQSKLTKSLQQLLRLMQLNLFEKRELIQLLTGEPPDKQITNPNQLVLC
jgi:putative transposase